MNAGKILRISHIFQEDGKTFIVAFDHGMVGITKGIERIGETIKKVIEGGADAVMMGYGIIDGYCKEMAGKTGVILTIPWDERYVQAAVKIGADAVKTGYSGPVPLDKHSMKQFGEIAREANDWGIPYMSEIVPEGTSPTKVVLDSDKIKQGCRTSADLGADFVKTAYPGNKQQFKEIVDSCLVPIVIMGGPKMNNNEDVFKMIKDAIEAGGAGVAMGRNVWQCDDPVKMTRAIAGIIHHNDSIEDALANLE